MILLFTVVCDGYFFSRCCFAEVRLAALRIMHRLIDISGNVSHIPRTT